MTDTKDSQDAQNTPDAVDGSEVQVGYCKPPKSGQFAKGRSGNPRGRPKRAPPLLYGACGFPESDIEYLARQPAGPSRHYGEMSYSARRLLVQFQNAVKWNPKMIKRLARSRVELVRAEVKRLQIKRWTIARKLPKREGFSFANFNIAEQEALGLIPPSQRQSASNRALVKQSPEQRRTILLQGSELEVFHFWWNEPIRSRNKKSTMTYGEFILKALLKMDSEGDVEAAKLFSDHHRQYPVLEEMLCNHHLGGKNPFGKPPMGYPVRIAGGIRVPMSLTVEEVRYRLETARDILRFWDWVVAVYFWEVEWYKKHETMPFAGLEYSTPESLAFFRRNGQPAFADARE